MTELFLRDGTFAEISCQGGFFFVANRWFHHRLMSDGLPGHFGAANLWHQAWLLAP
jgi:hypothetical protein